MSTKTAFDSRRYVRFGRYVGDRTEATPTAWHGNVRVGDALDVVQKAAGILNKGRPLAKKRAKQTA